MEEWVGVKWHHYITNKSTIRYREAAVSLNDLGKRLAVFFRALGGDPGLSLAETSDYIHDGHRTFLQKMAGSGVKQALPHFHNEFFFLPHQIDCFPSKKANEALYYWLTALASLNHTPHKHHWIKHNQYLSQQILNNWPGLRSRYKTLSRLQLQHRPKISSLPKKLQPVERALQKVIADPWCDNDVEVGHDVQPLPVMLWLYPSPINTVAERRDQDHQGDQEQEQKLAAKNLGDKKYKAEQMDDRDQGDGLIAFRLESLFTWSEFLNLDRSEEDTDDEDLQSVADDLDKITVSSGKTASKVKLDLDLPSAEYDDVVLTEGILLPEWHYKKEQLIEKQCALQTMALNITEPAQWREETRKQAKILKRQFESLKPQRKWLDRQEQGDEADLNSFLDFSVQRSMGKGTTDPNLYRQLHQTNRDLSTLLLADLSLSTDAFVSGDRKVIDVIRESLYIFGECLSVAGERFSITGFASKLRSHVRYYELKGFDDRYDDTVRNRIYAIKPNFYTRMGAAIRYATQQLTAQKTGQKLLLILTDGKPNDLDQYEGRYGMEDTKHAVNAARKEGLVPFCISIDIEPHDYLAYIFGGQSFLHIKHIEELPKKLPMLFYQLTN